ncbi:hypothetical protein D9M73_131250 [compost metagenome]
MGVRRAVHQAGAFECNNDGPHRLRSHRFRTGQFGGRGGTVLLQAKQDGDLGRGEVADSPLFAQPSFQLSRHATNALRQSRDTVVFLSLFCAHVGTL